MSPDSNVQIRIPETLIEDTIKAEIVRQFPDKEKFAEKCILELLAKKKNRYDKETLFATAVAEMIQEEAKAIFGEWIEENRAALRDALFKHLTANKGKRIKDLCKSLTENLNKWKLTCRLNINWD